MKKSIETIWKKGLEDPIVSQAPKITNFKDLESIYFIDQFKRRYRHNIWGLLLTGILVLLAFIPMGIPFIGLFIFALFSGLAILGQRALHNLQALSLGESNYRFLQAFHQWLAQLFHQFTRVYRIWTPLLFLAFVLAILKTKLFVPFLGTTLLEKLTNGPASYSLTAWSSFLLCASLLMAGLISYSSGYFFKREMQSLYGDVLAQLKRLLDDLDHLEKA